MGYSGCRWINVINRFNASVAYRYNKIQHHFHIYLTLYFFHYININIHNLLYDNNNDLLLQRIPSCSLKSPQPLKEFVVHCQTMPSRVKKSFCGCLQVGVIINSNRVRNRESDYVRVQIESFFSIYLLQ